MSPKLLSQLLTFPLLCIYNLTPLFSEPLGDSTQNISSKKPAWDITAAHGPAKTIEFDTDEGTWISLDVSPDGKKIVFDLLGDIYSMPVGGGEATLLSGGPAMEIQPRFSPDGSKISYTSDRAGGDNIWIMDATGTNARAVTKESVRLLNNAVWTPDGQFLIARKHFVNTRSLGAGEMWMYHISGGDGVQLTKRRNWQQDAGEPCLSTDGRYLFYSEDVSPGGAFAYNRDPYGVIYVINRLDRETGKVISLVGGYGGSARPQVSPDGKTLAFVRRVRLNTVLYLRNLETGEEWPIFDRLNRDAQETWAIFGVHPGFAWTPDCSFVVISAKGKIWKVNVRTKEAREIPFSVRVRQTVAEALRFRQKVSPEMFDVRMLREVTTSPDGKAVLYCALGHVWIKALPNGQPRRLTDERNFEFFPTFSPDGKWVAFVSWTDTAKGSVRKVKSSGGESMRLTRGMGTYVEPSFSRDGTKIVFRKLGGDALRGQTFADEPGVYVIPSGGGEAVLVTDEGVRPRFNRTGERIFLESLEGEKAALISVNLAGEHRRVHLVSDNAQLMVPSPDERWVAFTERFNSYVATLPLTGQPVQLGPGTSDFPVKRITRDAGMYLHWSPDSKTVSWSLGPELFSRTLSKTFAFAGSATDTVLEFPDTAGIFIGFQSRSDTPEGAVALTGATIITMKGDEVLSNAVMVIDRNRITAVGPSGNVSIPSGARVVDVTGRYIMPGIIDVHAHGPVGSSGIIPEQNWAFFANLAYGVTTEHDPSNDTEQIFSASEMQKAGLITGPRLFSTGTILYGAEGNFKAVVNSLEDARSHLRRLKAVGAFSVKSYNQPRRDQRQQIIQAGRDLNMMVVPEAGSTYFWNISQILDGHTGIEHSLPVSPLYKDVRTLFGQSKTGYTPTLIVSYGGLWGENYWFANTRVWENKRLLTYVPRSIVDARSRRRIVANDDDWNYLDNAKEAKAILDAGGKVQLGSHGQLQGLGAHWELWMLVQGGMTPMEAIRCATLHGAEYLGLDGEIGSLEPGKLADLIVMEKDPLADIRNSDSIRYVMLNGRLYDAATMDQIGTRPTKRPPFFWEGGKDPGSTEMMMDLD